MERALSLELLHSSVELVDAKADGLQDSLVPLLSLIGSVLVCKENQFAIKKTKKLNFSFDLQTVLLSIGREIKINQIFLTYIDVFTFISH